jgi:mannose-6-phosphate isomerase
VALDANQPPERFYRGGPRIDELRGGPPSGSHSPEDWIASVVSVFGTDTEGLTRLPDGRWLRDALVADPVGWLGDAHVARWGADPALLVKLLDAGERLPVHAHPSAAFTGRHLGLVHGKAEAWVLLRPCTVHLGFARDVADEELRRWVADQDTERMLAAMNPLEVSAGDSVLVPPGVAHSVGEGAFLVEVQEPTDLSLLLEFEGFAVDGRRDGHLGLGFDLALQCVERSALATEPLVRRRPASGEVLPAGAAPFFSVEQRTAPEVLRAGFSVLVVLDGQGELVTSGGRTGLRRGSTVLVPHAAGDAQLTGDVSLLRCRPPDAAASY